MTQKANQIIICLTAILVAISITTSYSQNCHLNGRLQAAEGGEPLIGAAIYLPALEHGVYSDRDGYFSLEIPCDGVQVIFQQLGFLSDTLWIGQNRDTFLQLYLQTFNLGTVTVKANRLANIPGKISVPVAKLKAMPALLGEPDIFRSLQRLPGISNAVEGTTGLVVRGGSIDQNLILLDGCTIYNNGHIFGFVSAINPAIVKHVDVYTGYIPGHFSGRLSSVVDIHSKDGDKTQRKQEVSIGSINSSWTIEGALGQNGRSSYLFSSRVAHSGILTLVTLPSYLKGKDKPLLFAGMYDLNAKLSWEGERANKLSLSLYSGDDFWGVKSRADMNVSTSLLTWGNKTASLRYVRPKGRKSWVMTLLSYNRYGNQLKSADRLQIEEEHEEKNTVASRAKVEEFKLQHNYKWTFRDRHTFMLGIDVMRQAFVPASVSIHTNQEEILQLRTIIPTYTTSLFANHSLPLGKKITLHSDLRYVTYLQQRFYMSWLEPRLSLAYELSTRESLFASYSRMKQPLHLITFNGNTYPYDYWLPATRFQRPENSRIFSLGYKWQQANWIFSVKSFYKTMGDLVALRTNRSLTEVLNAGNWDGFLLDKGIGKAYGVELLIDKTIGRFNGFIGYTWSRSWRKFTEINDGDWTPFVYDRAHDLEATINLQLTNRWSFHTGFVYQRGQPFTSPTAFIRRMDGSSTPIYTQLFNDRLPDIHRLDIMVDYEYRTVRKTPKSAKISFGLYNAYGRANPLAITFQSRSSSLEIDAPFTLYASRQSLFRFIPILNYSLKW